MLEIGSVIDGKYKVLNKIGQGGMSVVYLVMNERANKQWAIKEVRKDGIHDFNMVKQGLIVETDLLKKLRHPNLPSIVDVIDRDGSILIVMDYIEGYPLSRALKEEGAQPQEKVIEWAKQLCDVLGYLHSANPPIIYRDMKPGNIMLRPNDTVCLIDFGTAREYKETSLSDTAYLGTKGYAAPEQFGGNGQTDARTDIYCLGATMYHLVTGHNPAKPPYEMYPIRHWDASLSEGLEQIILKCTQKNPEDRYQSAEELMYALEHYDEMDSIHRKNNVKKLVTFSATLAVTIICLIAGFHCLNRRTELQTDYYEGYLSQARTAKYDPVNEIDEKTPIYSAAIKYNPRRGEAYLELLDAYIGDDDFSEEESIRIRELLYDNSVADGMINGKAFERNDPEGYLYFCYKMGIAYWYNYSEGKGDIVSSASWLVNIANSEYHGSHFQFNEYRQQRPNGEMSEEEMIRRVNIHAKLLYKISSYKDKMHKLDAVGDFYDISYGEYWSDLREMVYLDLENQINTMTALHLYKEVVDAVAMDASEFRSDGVEHSDMEEVFAFIEEKVDTQCTNDLMQIRQFANTIKEDIELARRTIDTAYTDVEDGSDKGGTDN